MLRDEINADLKQAMKAQDKRRISTLRLVLAALKDREIDARGTGKQELVDEDVSLLLQKMIKQRHESVEIYAKAGRDDLAAQEREEIDIISAYLPKQMSDEETGAALDAVIKDLGANGVKDMGRVMGALKKQYSGRMDFAKAGALAKAALAK